MDLESAPPLYSGVRFHRCDYSGDYAVSFITALILDSPILRDFEMGIMMKISQCQ